MNYTYGRISRPANRKFVGSNPKTERVREIEGMIAQGMKPKEIAEALGISPSTLSGFMRRYGIGKPN
jgi:DNA-binding CsgD family transcriptional regulator